MDRRQFIQRGAGAVLAAAGVGACLDRRGFGLVPPERPTSVEVAAIADARDLLLRAFGTEGGVEVFVGSPASTSTLSERELPQNAAPGAYRILRRGSRVVIAGSDPEGARNGLYRLLEELGFGFFRDGETLPREHRALPDSLDTEDAPRFRWRGDMIWDNYLGPSRYCASMWGEREWERALLFTARSRMNFLEYYPPLELVATRAFPEAPGLEDGAVWKAEAKHSLAKKVLARGRELGIHFMYVLSYGAFPEPVRRHYSHLEWRNGFLCAQQPELQELTERLWRALVDELGTDHWYAIRHRGEEEQSYSDPCRTVTKSEGFLQAFSVLDRVDSDAIPTVWTWGETLPDLFATFPPKVRAAHIRHGMANVFGELGQGREQGDGRPELPAGRRWLSGQFTVFGGNETLLRTAWSDAASIARDAAASAGDPDCEGFFQWPEWSDTSPWLSHAIARIGWDPGSFDDPEASLKRYARVRHGDRSDAFLAALVPLVRAGNARFMVPPRKRLVVPFFLEADELRLLEEVRAGVAVMADAVGGSEAPFRRDLVDVLAWVGHAQAHALEAEAVALGALAPLDAAEATWRALAEVLAQVPELSIVESARRLAAVGPLSKRVEESLWNLGCDFYHGYPLVLSPEAVELVYLPQLEGLRDVLRSGAELEAPGWFWHDFPVARWAEAVRKLPSEDAERFERVIRERIASALGEPRVAPAALGLELDLEPVRRLLAIELPRPRSVDAPLARE